MYTILQDISIHKKFDKKYFFIQIQNTSKQK